MLLKLTELYDIMVLEQDMGMLERRMQKGKKGASPLEKETMQLVYDHLGDG